MISFKLVWFSIDLWLIMLKINWKKILKANKVGYCNKGYDEINSTSVGNYLDFFYKNRLLILGSPLITF